jgi:hypothetical protein
MCVVVQNSPFRQDIMLLVAKEAQLRDRAVRYLRPTPTSRNIPTAITPALTIIGTETVSFS